MKMMDANEIISFIQKEKCKGIHKRDLKEVTFLKQYKHL